MNTAAGRLVDREAGSTLGALFSLNAVAAGFSFVTTVALANAIGAQLFGEYVFFVALGQYLLVGVQYGTDRTLVRDVLSWPWRTRELALAVLVIGATVLAVSLPAVAVSLETLDFFHPGGLVIMTGVAFRGLSLAGVFDATGRISEHAVITALERFGYLAGMWVLLLFMPGRLSLILIGLLSLSTAVAGLIVQVWKAELPEGTPRAWEVREEARRTLRRNGWLVAGAFAALTTGTFSKILLRPLEGATGLGAFGASWQVVVAGSIVTTQILRVGMPRLLSVVGGEKAPVEVRAFLFRYGLLTGLGAALVAVPAFLFPGMLVDLAFSPEYVAAAEPLRILAVLVVVVGVGQVAHQYLVAVGLERVTGPISVVGAISSPILLLLLVPPLGLSGAAWAVLVASALSTAGAWVAVWRHLQGLRGRSTGAIS